ncbi:solute carrier family 22 member 4-like [Anarhichas minor]|uniref:solute carrier family 22 member 4-like n=1 Tax=Anarhichas minor TaxID=65739 RepID=UPI003F73AC76
MSRGKDFDEITSFLGVYGFSQIVIIALLSLSAIVCGYTGMVVVFVSDTPEHHCKASNASTRTDVEVPFREQSSWIGPDGCSRYKLNGNWTDTARPSNDTEQCLDGWAFSTEGYTATIVSEWDLVCDNAWKVPFSTSLFFVGVLIGSFISGDLSDRFGRRPVFFSTMALLTVTPLIQATSVSWIMFCILNGLRGLGYFNYFVSLVLGSEMLSQTTRMSFALLGHCVGFGVGYALLPLVAYFIRGWRMLLVATAIPGFLFIPAWWMSTSMVFYGLSLNTSNLNGDVYLNCFISAAIDIVVYGATWALAKHVSRPTILFSTLMFCGIMLLIIKLVPEDMHVMLQVLALLGKTGVSAAYSMIIVFFTELIPTVIRNMGLGIASTAARIGTIICPYVIYMGVYSKILPYMVFGTITIMAAAVSMLLPDTRNSELPDLISQAKPIRGHMAVRGWLLPKDTAPAQTPRKSAGL